MNNNYPDNAIRVKFQPLTGGNHFYYIWPEKGKWFWYCLGNAGYGDTQEQAMFAARNWIRHGVKSNWRQVDAQAG